MHYSLVVCFVINVGFYLASQSSPLPFHVSSEFKSHISEDIHDENDIKKTK